MDHVILRLQILFVFLRAGEEDFQIAVPHAKVIQKPFLADGRFQNNPIGQFIKASHIRGFRGGEFGTLG